MVPSFVGRLHICYGDSWHMVVFNGVIISCSALHARIPLPTPTQHNTGLLEVRRHKNIYFVQYPPASPSLTTSVLFDAQNPVKLAPFVKCWLWVDKLACLRPDSKLTVINHNYRVGLAHGSCINIPLAPPPTPNTPSPITSPWCSRWLGHRLEVSVRPVITAASFTPARCLLFISDLLILNPSPPSGKIVI